MFTKHCEITDTSKAPFETYLYIETDNGFNREAYQIADDCPLDIEAMLNKLYGEDFTVECTRSPVTGSPNYAAIITDGRAPDSCIVWTSCDFVLTGEDY